MSDMFDGLRNQYSHFVAARENPNYGAVNIEEVRFLSRLVAEKAYRMRYYSDSASVDFMNDLSLHIDRLLRSVETGPA